jgi:hypothetical protein
MSITLNGIRVLTLSLYVPQEGAWVADVSLDLETGQTSPTGPCALVALGTTLVGRATLDASGRQGETVKVRVVGGAGWSKLVPSQQHTSPAGVPLSSVLLSLAALTGERVVVLVDEKLGAHYVRPAGLASEALAGRPHWVSFDGTTFVGPRLPAPPPPTLEVLEYDPTAQVVTAAADALVEPGFSVLAPGGGTEPLTVRSILYEITEQSARASLFVAPSPVERLRAAMRRLVLEPQRKFLAQYRYRVVSSALGFVQLLRTEKSADLPAMVKITMMPGIPGLLAELRPGSDVLVAFEDGNQARPQVVAFQGPDRSGYVPLRIALDADLGLDLGTPMGTPGLPVALAPGVLAFIASAAGVASAVASAASGPGAAIPVTNGMLATYLAPLLAASAAAAVPGVTASLKVRAL